MYVANKLTDCTENVGKAWILGVKYVANKITKCLENKGKAFILGCKVCCKQLYRVSTKCWQGLNPRGYSAENFCSDKAL